MGKDKCLLAIKQERDLKLKRITETTKKLNGLTGETLFLTPSTNNYKEGYVVSLLKRGL